MKNITYEFLGGKPLFQATKQQLDHEKHNVRILRVSPFFKQQTTVKQQLDRENLNLDYLAPFGWDVLMSSVWNNVGFFLLLF